MIYVNFTNHGIGGDGVDHDYNTEQADTQTGTITKRIPGRSSVVYVVTEAEPEQIIVEKLVEADAEIGKPAEIIQNDSISSSIQTADTDDIYAASDTTSNDKPQAVIFEITPLEFFVKDGMLSAKWELIMFSFLIALIIITPILIFIIIRNHFKDRAKPEKSNNTQASQKIKPTFINFLKYIYAVFAALAIVFKSRRTKRKKACHDKRAIKNAAKRQRKITSSNKKMKSTPGIYADNSSSLANSLEHDDTGESDIDYVDIPRLFSMQTEK